MALLTPNDIRNHRFNTTRFREGYDIDEVDSFLDEVTKTVDALSRNALGTDTKSFVQSSDDSAQYEKKIADLTARNSELEQQLKSARSDDQSSEASHNLVVAQGEVKNLTDQNSQLKAQLSQLNKQLDDMTRQAAKGSDSQALKGQLDETRKQLRDAFAERDQMREQGTRLEVQLVDMRHKLEDAQEQIERFNVLAQQEEETHKQISDLKRQLADSQKREEDLRSQVAKMEPSAETGSLKKISSAGQGSDSEAERATAMLALAMQLHDQYVDKGKAQRAQLIAEAETARQSYIDEGQQKLSDAIAEGDAYKKKVRGEADKYSQETRTAAERYAQDLRTKTDNETSRQRTEAENYANALRTNAKAYDEKTRTEADQYSESVKNKLFNDVKVIEGNITSLKKFEDEYRSRLKDFLGQLINQVSASDNYQDVHAIADDKNTHSNK
ncbi:MAG: DivIVA domain-containing protein [Aeriscardovia sp.]|nr:DivIVA domain-containing protein [Aeriscardovia sp.]